MAKKDKHEQHDGEVLVPPAPAGQATGAGPAAMMKRKEYEREMRLLRGELVAADGARIARVRRPADDRPETVRRRRGLAGSPLGTVRLP